MDSLIEQIFNDRNSYADSIELSVGDKKLTLGQLREMSTAQQKAVADKISNAEQRERVAQETSSKAANLLSELEIARTNLNNQKMPPATDDDFDKEEFWGPVRKRFSERDKKLEEAISKLDNLDKSVRQAASIWADDRWQNQFERAAPKLKKIEAYKDWDIEKVRNYAVENKLLDNHGFPSIERAVQDLTKASDLETVRKEAYEKGMQEGRTKARIETMARPSSATGGVSRGKGKSAVEEFGFEGLGDDAMEDPEITRQLAELSELGIV